MRGDDYVAEKPGGVGLELLFERVEEGLLVALLAEHAVERRESLGTTDKTATGAAARVAADAGLEHCYASLWEYGVMAASTIGRLSHRRLKPEGRGRGSSKVREF